MTPNLQIAARELVADHLGALALRGAQASRALSAPSAAILAALHLVGLAAFWRYFHQPIWLAVPTLAVLAAWPLWAWRRSRFLALETLAPLFFLYVVLAARVIAVRVLLAQPPYQDEASFPDPRLVVFQVEASAAAAFAYVALAQVVRLARGKARAYGVTLLALALGCGALTWFAAEAIGHRTRGVTATDPYAYAQMAVDLATRGTPLHAFPLFSTVVGLNIPWYPIEHVGYRLFGNLSGSVPSVWPAGGAVWLAILYRLFGEEGLYLATPLAALLSLLACAAFAWEYLRCGGTVERAAVAAIAVALLATSWEQVDRSIVPLVDVQAQLLSVLAIWMALRSTRGRAVWQHGAAAGLALGAAYLVRHTQVLLAVPLALAAWPQPRANRFWFLVGAGAAAFVVVLPDLWYHHLYMGGWLAPESNELALFSLSNIWPSVVALSSRFFAGNESGYLVPFLLYGAYRAWRDNPRTFAVLTGWVLPLLAFHLLYAAVRLRDLLPEYPAVVLVTAYGMVAIVRDLRSASVEAEAKAAAGHVPCRQAAVSLALFLALLLPALRTRMTIVRPFQPARVTFGYLTGGQRAAFDRLAALTPANAVIGSTMNDGPIDLYAQRATFRPGGWNLQECERFIGAMQQLGNRVYLLDDGTETAVVRRELSSRHLLRPVAVLDVPLFGAVDGTPGALWEIVR